MKVAKTFRWEGAHRLPWHEGLCRNLHGHSYTLTVAVEGTPDARGMLIDFKMIKQIVKPLVQAWDHSVLVSEDDAELLALLAQTDWKVATLPYDTTSENLCRYVANHLRTVGREALEAHQVHTITVRLQETETCYAELSVPALAATEAEMIAAGQAMVYG